jgi:hypothetical protein
MRLSVRVLVGKIVTVVVLVFLLGTVPAEAGWQYAQWGMSPEQVIAASNGEATSATTDDLVAQDRNIRKLIAEITARHKPGPRNPKDWTRVLARGHRQIDDVDSDIAFQFRYRKLESVHLDAKDCTEYVREKIFALLNSTYGAPIANEQHGVVQVSWSQPSSKTLVELMGMEGTGLCFVSYKPLPTGL